MFPDLSAAPRRVGACATPVTPVVCFIGVLWPLFRPKAFQGVRLEDLWSLRRLITQTPWLDWADVNQLARILATGFPAK